MKKLFSARYTAGAISTGMLLLRLVLGFLMLNHGYDKLVHFSERANGFTNFLGLGSTISLALCVFAEFFCSLFIILGLFTRLSCIPLIVNMCVIIFMIQHSDFYGKSELATMYLGGYLVLLTIGPGRISVDGAIGK